MCLDHQQQLCCNSYLLLMLQCRDHRWATSAPYPVFWLGSWVLRAAEYVVSLKPGTLRAGELARAYAHSQV